MSEPVAAGDEAAKLQNLRAWQARLEAAQNSQYSDLKASADKWASSVGILIGALGTISIIFVPKGLTDFSSDDMRATALGFATGGGLCGLAALICALWVSMGWPRIYDRMDAAKFEQQTINKTASGVDLLVASRWLTFAALLAIVIASSISAADTLSTKTQPVNVVVVYKSGAAKCGTLQASYKDVAQVTVVASCRLLVLRQLSSAIRSGAGLPGRP